MGSCLTGNGIKKRAKKYENNVTPNNTRESGNFRFQEKLIARKNLDENYLTIPNLFNEDPSLSVNSQENRYGAVGLVNMGNTCFISSAIQLLSNTQPLSDYFLNGLHLKEINLDNPLGSKGQLAKIFGNLIKEIWISYEEPIEPRELMGALKQHAARFSEGRQEDVQEFLAFLLDIIHEDLNRARFKDTELETTKDDSAFVNPKKKERLFSSNKSKNSAQHQTPNIKINQINQNFMEKEVINVIKNEKENTKRLEEQKLSKINSKNEKKNTDQRNCDTSDDNLLERIESNLEKESAKEWKEYLKKNRSIIVDLFQGQIKNTICCNECSHLSYKFEPIMYLSLPIPFSEEYERYDLTLDDCLREFTKTEELAMEDLWDCPKCKKRTRVSKQIAIWKVPNILVIHFKRFKFSQTKSNKLDTFISFPIKNLDLTKYLSERQKDKPIYDLYAIANHKGDIVKGHYYVFAKNEEDKKWYEFDDENVYLISKPEKRIVTKHAYLLFYAKSSVDYFSRQTLRAPDLWPYLQAKSKRESLMTLRESIRKMKINNNQGVNQLGRRNSENFQPDGLPNLVIETKQNNFLHQSHDTSVKKKQLNFSLRKKRELISIEDMNKSAEEEERKDATEGQRNSRLGFHFANQIIKPKKLDLSLNVDQEIKTLNEEHE